MLILCCYTDLADQTREWIMSRCPPDDRRFRYVGVDDYAYGDALAEQWRAGEDFFVVEHDVVPPANALLQLELCPAPYCAFPYAWSTCVGPALGCTRFRRELLEDYPTAMEEALQVPSAYGKPGHWRQIDVYLMRRVLRDKYGLQPHVHMPAATHLNPEKQLQPGASPEPVMRVEGWA